MKYHFNRQKEEVFLLKISKSYTHNIYKFTLKNQIKRLKPI